MWCIGWLASSYCTTGG